MPVFLTQEGKPRAQLCSKAIEKGAPSICALLDRAQAEFATLNDKLAHLRLAEASAAVLALADAVQADYERRKRAEAVLDYDDLIVKTQNLLSRADAAAWVLYKIDGGIDHILVDEAQDTNPRAMEHHRGLGGGVLCRRGRKRASCARCSPSAMRSSRSIPSKARTRRGSAKSAAPSGNGPRRSVSFGTRCR